MDANGNTSVLILSIYRDLAEAFVETVGGGGPEPLLNGHPAQFTIVAGDPIQYPAWDEHLAMADMIIMIVRFLDVHSLEKIKSIYRYLPSELSAPVGIFLLRDKGEIDFKVSCPACGQKLWLRDTDVGKRGRCPNCKKPFIILSQLDYLKTQLMLPESVVIQYVTREDPASCLAAMDKLVGSTPVGIRPAEVATNLEALKNATMRIQLQE
jgi:predicted RNA-binding Zn-ribbon protein involved in translation (DUF1610 family)